MNTQAEMSTWPAPEGPTEPLPPSGYTPPISGRFRAMPLMYGDAAEAKTCGRARGHILTVKGRDIVCERCPARWHDEGF